ncbi:MAG: AAA family ATPase [Gallionellaceae bacterium]|nr:AAA family ATPase [Gallionellaceae bacterium]
MTSPPPLLEVRLLRKTEIRHGEPLRFPYAKVLALLVYLLLESSKHNRELLTTLLWPEQDSDTARTNLRNAVHALRRLIGQERIGGDRHHVWFTPTPGDFLDTDLLRQESVRDGEEQSLCELVSGYSGELMAGFALPDVPEFMEWLDLKRLSCHRQVLSISERLFQQCDGDSARRLALAQAQTTIDPWNETFHLRFMQLLAERGQAGTALAHYDYLRGLYRRELDTLPCPEVRALASQLGSAVAFVAPRAATPATPAAPPPVRTRPIALLYAEIRCLGAAGAEHLPSLRRARGVAAETARRQGAHVCPTPDGSILAFFGYPDGLPNACQRALRAACTLRDLDFPADIQFRYTLHQGAMLLDPDSNCPDALGTHSDIVIKLASSARSGDILATNDFARRFKALDLAPLERSPELYLHGGIKAWRIVNPLGGPLRNEPPLIGRERQRGELRRLWRAAQRGRLRAALLGGPPGSGKSRLARWMLGNLADPTQGVVIECLQNQSEAPFAPIAEMVKRKSGIHPGDDDEARRHKLRRWLDHRHPHLDEEQRRMIAWLVGLPLEGGEWSPSSRRKCLRDALLAMLAHVARQSPMLVVVEDLHWADPSTLQLVEGLLASGADLPCLLLLTARPPLADTWQTQLPRIVPDPLNPEQSRALVQACLPTPPEGAVMERIVADAGGNPLYLEALAQASVVGWPLDAPPSGLEDSLLLSISRNTQLRRIAQGAAALGEEFDLGLLRDLFPELSDDAFHAGLRGLERHGLMQRSSGSRGRFHHALIRDALYHSQTSDERRQTHRRIHATAAALLPDLAQRQPHWLAHHAAGGGNLAGAIDLLERAAYSDLALAAHNEALRHFRAARELLERLPSSREHDRRALRLLLAEGNATVALRGYGAAETRAVFSQVLERGDARDDAEEVFLALYGLWLGGSSSDGYQGALRYVDKLQRIAEESRSPLHRLQTAYAYGNTHLWLGNLATARGHLESAVEIYEHERPDDLTSQFIEDTGVTSLSLLSWTLWLQGEADASTDAQARALDLAGELGHPYSRAFALACAARLELLRGEVDRVRQFSDALIVLADRHDFTIWRGVAAVMRAWVHCAARDAGGIPLARQSLDLIAQALPSLEVTILSMYTDGLYRLGDLDECARQLDHALARCAYWQDHYVEAELLRLRALCAEAGDDRGDAWRDAAVTLAVRQGARAILERIAAD